MSTEIATEHPHIVRKPGTCGGSPIIKGTRITVRHVAVLWKQGETVEEIVQSFPPLQSSWVHDAISYYLDHSEEIEQEIEANKIENVMAEFGGVMDEKGIIRSCPLMWNLPLKGAEQASPGQRPGTRAACSRLRPERAEHDAPVALLLCPFRAIRTIRVHGPRALPLGWFVRPLSGANSTRVRQSSSVRQRYELR